MRDRHLTLELAGLYEGPHTPESAGGRKWYLTKLERKVKDYAYPIIDAVRKRHLWDGIWLALGCLHVALSATVYFALPYLPATLGASFLDLVIRVYREVVNSVPGLLSIAWAAGFAVYQGLELRTYRKKIVDPARNLLKTISEDPQAQRDETLRYSELYERLSKRIKPRRIKSDSGKTPFGGS